MVFHLIYPAEVKIKDTDRFVYMGLMPGPIPYHDSNGQLSSKLYDKHDANALRNRVGLDHVKDNNTVGSTFLFRLWSIQK